MHTTVLLRFVLLLAGSISTHYAFTAPTPPPAPDEQAAYKKIKATGYGEVGWTVVHAANWVKVRIHVQFPNGCKPNLRLRQYMIYIMNILDFIATLTSANVNLFGPYFDATGWLPTNLNIHSIPPAIVVGTVLMCIGGVIRVESYKYLGRCFTFQLSIRRDHHLVTTGPYSIVRHPGYTGAFVCMIGMLIAQVGPGSIFSELGLWRKPLGVAAGLSLVANIAHIYATMAIRLHKEDTMLKEKFGNEWVEWQKRTPRRLFPGIY